MSDKELVKKKRDALIELTDDFADQHLNEEYKMLCRKLINKMGRKRQVPFLSGRMDIWAASVVYALGKINFLFDKKSKPYVSALDLCDYFGVKKSTTSQKAKQILDMFKIGYFDSEFSTKSVSERSPFNDLVMVNGLIVSKSALRAAIEREFNKPEEESDLKENDLESKGE